MGNAIMSFYSALIDLLGRCAPEMHVRLIETVNLLFFSDRFTLFSLPFLFFSLSTRGKVKLCVFVPSCALWCRLKTLWELSAYLSKCPSPTKVLYRMSTLITQGSILHTFILPPQDASHPFACYYRMPRVAHLKIQWF